MDVVINLDLSRYNEEELQFMRKYEVISDAEFKKEMDRRK